MEQLKNIKQCLVSLVQTQLGDLKKTDAKELGEVVDMIKDLEEAMYYCSITKAMEETKEKQPQNNINYYMEPKRYYDGGSNGSRMYTPYMEYAPYMMAAHYKNENDDNNMMTHSYTSRRMYMENKHNADHNKATKELEHFFSDLASEINEMIEDSSLEDKQLLVTKLTWLANKINNSTK